MKNKSIKFIDCFENTKFRYIDQTGLGRIPVSSNVVRPDLNLLGYEAYQTVNGFSDASNNKKEECINLNAFMVDIDGRKDPQELEKIKEILIPSFIIETGRGYHIYYLLDEPIFKSEVDNWDELVSQWEKIEQAIVAKLNGDPAVKDVTRIMRQVDTLYWKKTGEEYKKGIDGVFKIKGIFKNLACRYSMSQIEQTFPPAISPLLPSLVDHVSNEKLLKYAEEEKAKFFQRVNENFPMEERDSFQRLISGEESSLPPNYQKGRNNALIVVASLMKQAGWTQQKAVEHLKVVGWHGLKNKEIFDTVNSAFESNYTYSYKHELINWNMSPVERDRMQTAFNEALKKRKEIDKVRFSTYEREIVARYPHLRKNEIGIIYNYDKGVYKPISDQELSGIILNALMEDLLWNFRTPVNVKTKVDCLISIIPDLKITNWENQFLNLNNGILDMKSGKLEPHNPNFVSLIKYPVDYSPYATCPIWEKCMDDWTEGEEKDNKKLLLQQFAGYTITSSMLYDKALFLVGDGGNGKSTFVDTIAMVIGHDAVSHIDLESLYGQYGMHGLIGKRLNIIEEVHNNYYQSNKLKKLISGEMVTIDIKYKPQFTFRPQAKFIFAVNQMPRVDDTSTATERRMCVVQFKNNFRDNPNRELRSDLGLLHKELSGVLNWMLKGVTSLVEDKDFVITKEQTQMLAEYRQENSSVEGFIGECLDFEDKEKEIGIRELYDDYKSWCTKDGRKFKANIAFTKEMRAYGIKTRKFYFVERGNGHTPSKFVGVSLAEDSSVYKDTLSNW